MTDLHDTASLEKARKQAGSEFVVMLPDGVTEVPKDILSLAKAALYPRHKRGFVIEPLFPSMEDLNQLGRVSAAILAERERSRKRVEELEAGLRMIEAWWVTRGMLETTSIGAPYEMFHIRALLHKEGTDA